MSDISNMNKLNSVANGIKALCGATSMNLVMGQDLRGYDCIQICLDSTTWANGLRTAVIVAKPAFAMHSSMKSLSASNTAYDLPINFEVNIQGNAVFDGSFTATESAFNKFFQNVIYACRSQAGVELCLSRSDSGSEAEPIVNGFNGAGSTSTTFVAAFSSAFYITSPGI